ncbi:MAG: hypothetical protein ACXWV2_11240 [Chitinophagaceae bacterium]
MIDRINKQENKFTVMNKSLHISAIFDQPGFLESFVEKLADRRYDIGYSKAIVPKDLQAMETSSAETFTSGTIAIDENSELINMPLSPAFYLLVPKRRKVNTAFHGAVHFHNSKRDYTAAGLFINEIFPKEFNTFFNFFPAT